MNTPSLALSLAAFQPVAPVRLITEAPVPASEPWPVGYTMTVWGVAIGITVLIALIVTTWLRLSPHARALAIQTLAWRLSPSQLLALRVIASSSGTPAAVLLISRSAFESAAETWAKLSAEPGVSTRRALASLSKRVYGISCGSLGTSGR